MLKTIEASSVAEFEERKSKFIAFLIPYIDFNTTLSKLRREHRKASHFVTAFRTHCPNGGIEEGCSDDGEPSGTSGMPILKVLQGAQLVEVGLVVVRYFGGTKLGTGGLSRAYSATAKLALEDAKTTEWISLGKKQIMRNFSDIAEIESIIADNGLTVLSRDFSEKGVHLLLEGPIKIIESLK